jgi:PKD repeat protein
VQWTFGDGAGANDASASHTYRISGNFAPTVVIRDRGREGVCRQSVSVVPPPQPPGPTAPPNTLPRVLVKLEPAASGPAPYTLTINACPTYDVDDDPMTFRIVFGDRTPDVSGDCRPVHTYQARGTYVVRVCVSDGKGETCKQHLVTAT